MLLDLTSQEKISYGSKKHAFSDDKVTDAIKFLTDYKFRDKDLLWSSHIEDYCYNKIENYRFKFVLQALNIMMGTMLNLTHHQ